ncbi:MAG: 1,4-dihydroxy-6-naphthoate synthase [Acidobacteriota bacterium]|nr:1,4-dihydroxy-6-naphthoate synthase [Acidobacteriota bacterium]
MRRLAISPCPNDTFAFYALIHGKTDLAEIPRVSYADIEELNRLCFQGDIDFCKISFGAYLHLRDRFTLLEAGSALGFGCGPLVVAARDISLDVLKTKRIAIPGQHTTAAMLLRLMLGAELNTVEMVFDRIMPAVAAGEVDAGLIIHESRFTYAGHGLVSLVDLGDWWERTSGHPIPLGGIVARKDLPAQEIAAFDRALTQSVDYARAHAAETMPFMQSHAQEMEPRVMQSHVDLYVNDYTRALGARGREAINYLVEVARDKGLLD